MEHKIVIADCDHDNIDVELSILAKYGLTCDWRNCITEQSLIKDCQDATVLLIEYANITRRVLEALPNLKQVVRYGVGLDTVDIDAATEHGVQICNVPDFGMNEVADHAMAHTLYLLRKLYITNSNIRSGTWDYVKTVPIHRFSCLTIGIIGLGRIGKQYAKRANAFGFRIIASDDRAFDVPDYVTMVPFETLLEQSDVVSLNCPRNNNIDLVSDREFSMMKKGACIINVSRGGLINEDALERALSSGKIAGAGIDVVSSEPMPRDHPLLKHDNVSISPHMAWYSEESFLELCSKVAEEAVRFVRGEELCYPVNKIQICNRYYDFKFNKNKERS